MSDPDRPRVTALLTTGASFPPEDAKVMAVEGGEEAWKDPRRAAIWAQEHRLLKVSALYADHVVQFDSSPAWTNALVVDVGLELRGKSASLTEPAYKTVGVAADAARAYYTDLAIAASNGLLAGRGWRGDQEQIAAWQAELLTRTDTVPVLPPPAVVGVGASRAWEGALAAGLLGALEGFPDADMDVVLDVRERNTGSRVALRSALAQVAKELVDAGEELTDDNAHAALHDMRVRLVDPALAELRDEIDALGARRWLLRLASDFDLVGAVTMLTLVAATVLSSGTLPSLLAALGAAVTSAAGSEANFRRQLRGELRHKPMLVLHETAEGLSRQR